MQGDRAQGSAVRWTRAPGAPTRWGRGRSSHAWLVLQFALKDFKIRYTHSTLGYAWSVLNPLLFFLIYYFVFTTFVRLDVPNYEGFLLLGVALWNFYSEGTTNGASSLLARADLLTKTVVPRQIMVYAALMSASLTFVINLGVLMLVLAVTGTPIALPAILFPLLLVDLVLLTLGTAMLLAPLYVRYRDVGYLWNIALQIGFWLTPIIYLDVMMPERWRWIVWVNPVGRIIGDSRRALIYGWWPGARGLLLTTAMSIAVCALGYVVFRRMQNRLVEHL
jgi:lipopolysaccharide transport system permease protein